MSWEFGISVSISEVTQIRVSEKSCSSFLRATCIAGFHLPTPNSGKNGGQLSQEMATESWGSAILFGDLLIIITNSLYPHFVSRPNWIYSKNPTIFLNKSLRSCFHVLFRSLLEPLKPG